ncbi:MAG: LysR family transcriptional regulator [Myxococcaceae bacterium]|nr:LysR family transcriptional regulator [Myxococcaceae bacterium]
MRETHLSRVDLNLLVVLQALFETRSVTGAAKRLDLSQPAASRALGRLRALLDDPLFVRTPRGLEPTPRAEPMRRELDLVLEQIQTLVAGKARFDPATSTRAFTAIAADYSQATLLPHLLERLAREAPHVSLRVIGPTLDWERMLTEGQADFLWSPPRKAPQTIVHTPLFDEGFGFVVRKGHPIAKRPLNLERFLSLRHISLSPEGLAGNPLDAHLATLGKRRTIAAQVPSFLVLGPLLASTDLGATLPTRIIEQQASRWGLVRLELPFWKMRFTTSNAWHERFRHDPGHAWLRQCILDAGKALR